MQSFAEELQIRTKSRYGATDSKLYTKRNTPYISNSKIEGACQLLINSYFQNLDPKNRFVLSSTEKFDAAMSILIKNGYRSRQGTNRSTKNISALLEDLKQMESSITSIGALFLFKAL
jgi:hypothetical protein